MVCKLNPIRKLPSGKDPRTPIFRKRFVTNRVPIRWSDPRMSMMKKIEKLEDLGRRSKKGLFLV